MSILILRKAQNKSQRLVNNLMLIDGNSDGLADSWSFSKHANHTVTQSINGGQVFDITASSTAGNGSYFYQQYNYSKTGKYVTLYAELYAVPTSGTLTISSNLRFRMNTSTISQISISHVSYNTPTLVTINGVVPEGINNIFAIFYIYNETANATGTFYFKNTKLMI
jgi:hypothetical protein